MSKRIIRAWHFTGATLRDGRPIPAIGKWLVHDGPVKMCDIGLHASVRLWDAITFAPGATLHRVECADIVQRNSDKLVCRRRRIVATVSADRADQIFRRFARVAAYTVIDKWDAPELVRRYLETGDESIRAAAAYAADADARAYAARAYAAYAYAAYAADAYVYAAYAAAAAASYTDAYAAYAAAYTAACAAVRDAACDAAYVAYVATIDAYGRELERMFLAEMGVKEDA
jgi:hypothetical protein